MIRTTLFLGACAIALGTVPAMAQMQPAPATGTMQTTPPATTDPMQTTPPSTSQPMPSTPPAADPAMTTPAPDATAPSTMTTDTPMSKADTKQMKKCKAMNADAMAKDTKCSALMAAHPNM